MLDERLPRGKGKGQGAMGNDLSGAELRDHIRWIREGTCLR